MAGDVFAQALLWQLLGSELVLGAPLAPRAPNES